MANSIKALRLLPKTKPVSVKANPYRLADTRFGNLPSAQFPRIGQAKPIRQVGTCLRVFFSCIGHSKPIRLADTSFGETSVFNIGHRNRYAWPIQTSANFLSSVSANRNRYNMPMQVYQFLFGLNSSLSPSLCSKT
ncbi:unnamed protein product [Cochlearia groenlandica]